MFGRTTARDTVADVATAVARDEKLRQRLGGAVVHGVEAGRRAGRQAGVTGLAVRLSTDPELRKHLTRAVEELQAARKRLERKPSHRRRNVLLLVAGTGVAVVAFVPPVRRRVTALVSGGAAREPDAQWSAPRVEDTDAVAPVAAAAHSTS